MEESYEKRGYLLEDFRLFHLRDQAGTQTDYHYHSFCKLLLLRSGSGGYSVEGQRYHLMPGDIVLIGSRCVHRPEFQKGIPYDRSILYISPEFLRTHSTGDGDLFQVFGGAHVLRLPRERQQRVLRIIDQLEQELSGGGYGREILCRGLVLALLVSVGRELQDPANVAEVTTSHPRVLELLRYLDSHLTEEITADGLAEQFYMSKYHMMRMFRRETGCSIHGYLIDRRLLHARDLIARGVSATEACFQAGWKSYSSFTRAFHKRFGTTPTGRGAPEAAEETFE